MDHSDSDDDAPLESDDSDNEPLKSKSKVCLATTAASTD